MRDVLMKVGKRVPYLRKLISKLEQYRTWVPPGHYYSPIPSIAEFERMKDRLYNSFTLKGIDLNDAGQQQLLEAFKKYYPDLPFDENKKEGFRYYYKNVFFEYFDAIALFCFIRHLEPKNIIEIGSGHSSALALDTNEYFLNNQVNLTFIEPYPERLHSILKPTDRIHLIEHGLQDVDMTTFDILSENDILFIDSTHISKVGSDVNLLFFEIIPSLKKGVYIHIHDIFYPFEYPAEWVYEGRAWNELYLLRSFLQYNRDFSVQFFNAYLANKQTQWLAEHMPLCLKNTGGSIWLRKEV